MSTDRDAGPPFVVRETGITAGPRRLLQAGGYRRGQGSRGSDAPRARDGCPYIGIYGY